jgi:acetylornithine deacetylase
MTPAIQTLSDLVRINSVNPAFQDGRPEAEIAAFIGQFFSACGIETWEQEVFPGRPNLVARLPGRNSSRRIVFEAHTDTASVAGMSIPPFEPEIRGGLLYGRGACDTKAGLAAMMHALASLARERLTPPCEVWAVAAADEEYSFRGVLRLCQGLTAAAGVVSEPTSMRLVTAHKGCLRFRIHTRGVAAHSSKPQLGVNAITAMARVVLAIEKDSEELAQLSHPLLDHPTCSIGTIRGGAQVNIVPDWCSIEIDRRLLPSEQIPQVLEQYDRLLGGIAGVEAHRDEPMLESGPLQTRVDSAVAVVAAQVLSGMGLDPAPVGVPYGSDASKLSQAGIPSIVLGPGSIDQAHAAAEYVECGQVEQAVEFYRRFMLAFE